MLSNWTCLKFCRLVKSERQVPTFELHLTLPKRQILDSLKFKVFADDNFEFYKSGRKISKWVENAVGKGEIALTGNFSFSHSVFKRLVLQTHKNQGLFVKGLK